MNAPMKGLYRDIWAKFKQAGLESPELEARILLKNALKVSDSDLIAGIERVASAAEGKQIESLANRRLAGEPISRIFGEREFWGLPFKVTPAVLDPRPDTETLVEEALKALKGKPPMRILDLGTGSGCILIALLHEWPEAEGIGLDISVEALVVAQENAARNGVEARARFAQGSWAGNLDDIVRGPFELIVSNPPYIPVSDIPNLQNEVKNYDPILALEGGADGLDAYRGILTKIKTLLSADGQAFLECGIFQAADVARLAEKAGLSVRDTYKDLAGVERVVQISLGKSKNISY